jgi:hypothetical protein
MGIGAGLGVFSLVTKGVEMVTGAIGDSIKAARDDALSVAQLTASPTAAAVAALKLAGVAGVHQGAPAPPAWRAAAAARLTRRAQARACC